MPADTRRGGKAASGAASSSSRTGERAGGTSATLAELRVTTRLQ